MEDRQCVDFLREMLPQAGLRWPGFRRVRRTVCKRLSRRMAELGLADLAAYRDCLRANRAEWASFDAMCRIPISRFYRDRGIFAALADQIVPELAAAAAGAHRIFRCWSLGCASGEEPYSIALLWRFRVAPVFPDLRCRILATDADPVMIERAQVGCYAESSLRDLPTAWRAGFKRSGGRLCLDPAWRGDIEFRCQDVRREMPGEVFDLILCRNLVFTYFDESAQRRLLPELARRLMPDGALVIGRHESVPPTASLRAWRPKLGIFRLAPPAAAVPAAG
jgi:chemotaxis protein methyltransferase CheR